MSVPVDLYFLTADGLVRFQDRADGKEAHYVGRALESEIVREVIPDPLEPGRLYAATTTDLYTSDDDGVSWKFLPAGGLTYRDIFSLSAHPIRAGELYVGTGPAAVFVSSDGGRSFRELLGLRDLPNYYRWTFPPPPHLPHVRRIALDARVPDEIVLGIEEGGAARSRDRGETWEDISGPVSDSTYGPPNPQGVLPYAGSPVEEGVIYRDIHDVVRDPSNLERFYASTGRGMFRSDDGGAFWRRLEYGLGSTGGYAMPMAVNRFHPERVYFGFASKGGPTAWKGYRAARPGLYYTSRYSRDTSEEAGGAGAVFLRTDDRGETWRGPARGLPEQHAYMICGIQTHPSDPDTLYTAYTDGTIYTSGDGGDSWRQLVAGVEKVVGFRVKPVFARIK